MHPFGSSSPHPGSGVRAAAAAARRHPCAVPASCLPGTYTVSPRTPPPPCRQSLARSRGAAGGQEGRAVVVLPVFVGGLLELAPRCPRSGDAGAAINHPPAPPPRPLPPPAQPSADAQSGTRRLERRQAGRPACLTCMWAILKHRVATQIGEVVQIVVHVDKIYA